MPLSLLISFWLPSLGALPVWNKYQINGFTQGTTYSVTYYATKPLIAERQLDSIFSTIDQSLSIYQPNSLINQFNASAHGVYLDLHLNTVVRRAQEINRATNGLFDITVLPLMQVWGFTTNGIRPQKPNAEALKKVKNCMGNKRLKWKGNELLKTKPCVQIDVNGIAQGYTVDVVSEFLLKNKINDFLVEIGGEIRVNGKKQPSRNSMKIGIQSPLKHEKLPQSIQKIVQLETGAITTSGNYQKFYESNGKKISHLMNPKTGQPVLNDLISVTVYAQDAITADGYDNALMAMGLQKAFCFLKKNKKIQAYFIYKDKNGMVKDTATTQFYKLIIP